jgi:hypothetical protein
MDVNRSEQSDPPPLPPVTLEYRRGGRETKSQWWTDGDAYGAAMVYGLMGLMILGAVGGGLWWVVSHLLGLWLGW